MKAKEIKENINITLLYCEQNLIKIREEYAILMIARNDNKNIFARLKYKKKIFENLLSFKNKDRRFCGSSTYSAVISGRS